MTRLRTGLRLRSRRGLTIIELILALVVGLVVLTTVTGYVGSTDRNISANSLREDYSRNARFVGLALRRDLGEAGVGIESLVGWGTVGVYNDTITVLKVPFTPNMEQPYNLALNPSGTTNSNSNAGQNCGNTCMRLRRLSAGTALTLQPGMLARIQVANARRLILVSAVGAGGPNDSIAVNFRPTTTLLRRRSATTGATPVNAMGGMSNANTTVQRLDLVAYWRDAQNNLWRATRMDPATGNFVGEIVATGCTQFNVQLVFVDGGIANNADSTIANRAYDQINAIRVTATFQSTITDSRINGGQPLARTYVYHVQPRNLIYERNRP
jgi:hypothetical protein